MHRHRLAEENGGRRSKIAKQAAVFLITFIAYALIHASRKTLSTVKPSMIEAWTRNRTDVGPLFPSVQSAQEFLALLDAAFLFAYAIGLFFAGMLGDIYDPRIVLSIGMWLSAIATFLFGTVTEYCGNYSPAVYFILWTASGLFQSVGWPTAITIMANWFGHSKRGLVMGLWSPCASVGNILGTLIASRMVLVGYEYAFAANSVGLFFFTFVVFFALSSAPDVREPEEGLLVENVVEVRSDATPPTAIGFLEACLLPGVISYSLAYACLKMVNYGFFFWLPFYLASHFKWPESEADALSIWYDVGGIVAAVLAGAASDRFSTRTPIILPMLLGSSVSLYLYSNSGDSEVFNMIMLVLTGFFIGGPANLISGAVAADLGRAAEIRENTEALSTVTGIVDGTGSIGAAVGQLLIPAVKLWFGWSAVFQGFIILTLLTVVCLLPLLISEFKQRRRLRAYSELSIESARRDDVLSNHYDGDESLISLQH